MKEELIDVLDENGIKTAKILTRNKYIKKNYGIGLLLLL